MSFDGDPGNAVTALCAAEIALSLSVGGPDLPGRAGILTPSTAVGDGLADRLVAAGKRMTPSRDRTGAV